MNKNLLETIVGFVVIACTLMCLSFVYRNSTKPTSTQQAYALNAVFQNVDGIINGSDVMIAGIKIGKVASIALDAKTYEAIVTVDIYNHILIPVDSRASIVGSGIIGGNKYISIDPGVEEKFLANKDQIANTTSPVNLETLIGKFIYSMNNKSGK